LTKRVSRIVLSVVSLYGLGAGQGCSFLLVQPPAEHAERADGITCTTNRAAPVIDTIFMTTNLASAVYVAGQDNVKNQGEAMVLGLTVATLWMSSAILRLHEDQPV
jgi:hypothetical protein